MSNVEMPPNPAIRFAWCSSFMGCVEYEVRGDGEAYRIEERREASEYERSIYNGTHEEWQRDCLAAVGTIHRRYGVHRVMSACTVEEFNAWRAREHEAFVQKLTSDPERYGVFTADDPLLKAPQVVRGVHYEIGTGWVSNPA